MAGERNGWTVLPEGTKRVQDWRAARKFYPLAHEPPVAVLPANEEERIDAGTYCVVKRIAIGTALA